MKKSICFMLCLIFLFSFAGCKEKGKTSTGGVDIAYYTNIGVIPESQFKIGDEVPKEDENSDRYFFTADAEMSYFSNGDFVYYYSPAAEKPTVYAIAAFSKFYGFEIGAVSIEVSDMLAEQGISCKEREPEMGELFFLPSGGNFSVIEYKAKKHTLLFVFEENSLCAAFII